MIIILLAGCLSIPVLAQDKPVRRFHEFGITFSSLNNFGLRYKYGSEKTRFRFSLLSLNLASLNEYGRKVDSSEHKQQYYGAGLRIGFDKRIPLFSTFTLLLGGEVGVTYDYLHDKYEIKGSTPNESTRWTVSPGISFIFGVNYVVKDHLVLGAEINPTLSYTYGITKTKAPTEYERTTNNIGFNLVTSGAGLYIAYRFGK